MNKTVNPALPIALLALGALAFGQGGEFGPRGQPGDRPAVGNSAPASVRATGNETDNKTGNAAVAAGSAAPAESIYVIDNPRLAASFKAGANPRAGAGNTTLHGTQQR